MRWLFVHSILYRIETFFLHYYDLVTKIPRYATIICSLGFKRILLIRIEHIFFDQERTLKICSFYAIILFCIWFFSPFQVIGRCSMRNYLTRNLHSFWGAANPHKLTRRINKKHLTLLSLQYILHCLKFSKINFPLARHTPHKTHYCSKMDVKCPYSKTLRIMP